MHIDGAGISGSSPPQGDEFINDALRELLATN